MTTRQKDLVRTTFAELEQQGPELTDLFYGRLFEIDPALRELFRVGIPEQGRKFMDMMRSVVDHLEPLDGVVPVLWQLGKRHGGYGVRPADYATVCDALLWAIEQRLGERGMPEVLAAWRDAYDIVAAAMTQAAAEGIVPRRGEASGTRSASP
jgi:hemoglobin-like flavoprotein